MAETYQDIVNELKEESSKCRQFAADYYTSRRNLRRFPESSNPDLGREYRATDMALDVAKRVREAVSGDPSEWWVSDGDGNHIHLGDTVYVEIDQDGSTRTVSGFERSPQREGDVCVRFEGSILCANRKILRKITREKIIEKALDRLLSCPSPVYEGGSTKEAVKDLLEEVVDKAMKLGAEQG